MNGQRRICVIGLGYIGLPTSAVLAQAGFQVIGVDVCREVVDSVNKGKAHIMEPDLDGLLQKVVRDGRLKAALKPVPADIFIVAVPTPLAADESPDVSYVKKAIQSIAPVLAKGNLVIVESTVPVGTTEAAARDLARLRRDLTFPQQAGEDADVSIAFSPERVLPGRILAELIQNDRSVGGMTKRCTMLATQVYASFVRGEIIRTSVRTAEMVKLAENAFRDVNIAFANEISGIAERLGLNPWEVIRIANRHPRVAILTPGPGVGGHCIPIDPYFLIHQFKGQAKVMSAARQINNARPGEVVKQVLSESIALDNPTIACLGLTFKADSDDLRNSPALDITMRLAAGNRGRVIAVEPNIAKPPKELERCGVALTDTVTAIDAANVIVLLVGHRQFRYIDRHALSGKRVIDTRGLWSAAS
jgi:UDP-N-acetyl-D-mannosaminuronic acid dehydrogenase